MTVRLQEEFFVDGDQSIIKLMEEAWNKNSQSNQTYWFEGTRDVRFKAGDQNLWNEIYTDYPVFQKRKWNFNRIRRVINMIGGHQRRTRNATTVFPQDGSDEQTADQLSKTVAWVNQQADVYQTISGAFEGALTTGMNLLSIWMDYRSDPINGDIRVDNLSYNGVMMDSFFSKKDLSDATFIWTRKYLSKEQVSSLMPQRKDEIMNMKGSGRDDKFTFLPENINMQNPDLLSYDEFWRLDYRDMKLLVDTISGETMEWKGNEENLKGFLKQFPQVRVQKTQKETVKLAVVVNNRVFFDGLNPFGIDRYPFVPVLAYFEPDAPFFEWKIQGVVRSLRDAQFLYNRRKVIELDILESQINSGMKVMEDSLIDDNDAFLSGQGRGLFIKKDAPLGMESVQQILPPQIPPSMTELSQLLANEINQISGVNEELLGAAQDDKAGILSMLRQGAGLTTLEVLFDNLDDAQKLLGELTISLIQNNFTPGKIARIINQQPTDQFFDKSFQKFDAVVGEGLLTDTQRKATFVTLLEMKKLGIDIPDEMIIDKAPIPDKKELKELILARQEQASQLQQKQQQLELQQLEAQNKLVNARATADQGLGIERLSRIKENEALAVERRAAAIKDLELAALDKAKAAKELQGIDLSQLEKLINILNQIQNQDIVRAKIIEKSEDLDTAQNISQAKTGV